MCESESTNKCAVAMIWAIGEIEESKSSLHHNVGGARLTAIYVSYFGAE